MHHHSTRLATGLTALALLAVAPLAHAQSAVSLATLAPYTENFDDLNTAFPSGIYNTATATVTFGTTFPVVATNAGNPINAVLIQPGLTYSGLVANGGSGTTTDFSTGGFYSRTGTYSNTNSARALREDTLSTDLAFGGKLGSAATLTAQFTNATGADIASWSVAYNIERYSDGTSATATTVAFAHSTDGTTYTPFGTDYASPTAAAANAQLASIASTGYTQNVPLLIASGASVYFRWTITDPAANGRHVGLDDLVVTPSAIPEPAASAACLGLMALGCFMLRRRRAN
jgi:hypothetical protein